VDVDPHERGPDRAAGQRRLGVVLQHVDPDGQAHRAADSPAATAMAATPPGRRDPG
jgi:hypothetical protein